MPLLIYQKDIADHARLGVWKASETTVELTDLVQPNDSELRQLAAIRLDKRKREWLCTRILLKTMASGKTLSFLPNGKPVLSHGLHLSISHSGELAGMIVSDMPVGLDIQGVDERLLRIEQKFTNPVERRYLPLGVERVDYLVVIWSAKEAVFKYFGELVDFSDDIVICPFSPDQSLIHADYSGRYGQLHFELHNQELAGCRIVMTTKVTAISS